MQQYEDEDPTEICRHLGVETFPSVFFFKNNTVVWSAAGSHTLPSYMNEGMLYFSESPNLRSRDHVTEMTSVDEYRRFMAGEASTSDVQVCLFVGLACLAVVVFTVGRAGALLVAPRSCVLLCGGRGADVGRSGAPFLGLACLVSAVDEHRRLMAGETSAGLVCLF